jgi:sugar lactone lactonase YvrE
MPAIEMGRPTGLAVDRDGTLVVADTHYHRIARYNGEGRELSSFGGVESRDAGKFIYPVGLALAGDGTIYVSEYGGNDRIQVFTRDGKLLRSWGQYGEADGEFKRPQGLALAKDRLYVADAGNHRVQVFSTDGKHVASWGDLRYPYSVSVGPDGNVLVAEYGRHRVSKWTPDGRLVATAGEAGARPGQLDTPWGAVAAGERVVVVDAKNHRVQSWPASMWKEARP